MCVEIITKNKIKNYEIIFTKIAIINRLANRRKF